MANDNRIEPRSETWAAVLAHIEKRISTLTSEALNPTASHELRERHSYSIAELRKLAALGTKTQIEPKLITRLVFPEEQ